MAFLGLGFWSATASPPVPKSLAISHLASTVGKHGDEYLPALDLAGVGPGNQPEGPVAAARVSLEAGRFDETTHDPDVSFEDAALGDINGLFDCQNTASGKLALVRKSDRSASTCHRKRQE